MFVIIGFVVLFGSVFGGYMMHGGQMGVLMQISEFVIIGGAGLGALIAPNPPSAVKKVFQDMTAVMTKKNPYDKQSYSELLQVLYELFSQARKNGLNSIEDHVENPEASALFSQYPFFHKHHHAVKFLSDTMKVILSGAVEEHHLSEILEMDLEQYHHEEMESSHILATVGDAMPGFGICAAVLGVVITMGYIDAGPEVIGQKVAAALVGTFLGILLAYGFFGPLASAVANRAKAQQAYLACVRVAILSFVRGDNPLTCVEFARRNIHPHDRPSFSELEAITKGKK